MLVYFTLFAEKTLKSKYPAPIFHLKLFLAAGRKKRLFCVALAGIQKPFWQLKLLSMQGVSQHWLVSLTLKMGKCEKGNP